MSSRTVRITAETHKVLRRVAASRGESMQTLLDEAVETLRRNLFLLEANQAFARLQKDPRARRQEREERRVWDRALADDLRGD